jgi:hypothetical protein
VYAKDSINDDDDDDDDDDNDDDNDDDDNNNNNYEHLLQQDPFHDPKHSNFDEQCEHRSTVTRTIRIAVIVDSYYSFVQMLSSSNPSTPRFPVSRLQ